MSQTWNVTLLVPVGAGGIGDNTSEGVGAGVPLTPAAGVGDTTSAGVGAAGAPAIWPVTLFTGAAVGGGSGNTTSQGVGTVTQAAQVWAVTLVDSATGSSGNTLSQGGGTGEAVLLTWYTLTGGVTGTAVVCDPTGGNTLSEGVGEPVLGTTPGGVGETLSAGVGDVTRVVPPGVATLGPYWAPGELVTAYRVWEWKGAIAARLNAGPGPVVTTAVALPDSTVEFVGLTDDHYIAVGAEGQRRYFMVGQP